MSILSWLADRLVLCPTTHPIDPAGKERFEIPVGEEIVEAWVGSIKSETAEAVEYSELIILKFPGTAGRAERAGVHPAELFAGVNSEIWTINHRGYGGSTGPATLASFSSTIDAVWKFLKEQYPERAAVVVGNSLGCISALNLAARYDVAGMLLRNPPPIAQMIRTRPRYSWWNLGMSSWVAAEVPDELDAIGNAKNSNAPCLFVQSKHDRIVPCKYQNMIIDSYSGPKRLFQIADADHHEPVPESQQDDYLDAIRWLGKCMIKCPKLTKSEKDELREALPDTEILADQ